jgi:hypothetical protein
LKTNLEFSFFDEGSKYEYGNESPRRKYRKVDDIENIHYSIMTACEDFQFSLSKYMIVYCT